MSYNGSGTFNINTSGQPVVSGTVISDTVFNALTADLAVGLTTAITKDGQTACTARIPFANGINASLTTDSSSTGTGSIITAGGIGVAKAVYIGTTLNVAGHVTVEGVTSTGATGTGKFVFDTSPTIVTPTIASFVNATHNHTNAAGGGQIAEGALSLTDVTTANVSTSAHGFTPKAPNSAAQFLRGDASWAVPSPVYSAQGSNFTASSNSSYWITAGSVTITLPASPADGDFVTIVEANGSSGASGCSVARNGKTIMGFAANLTIDSIHFSITLTYRSSSGDWRLV